LHLLVEFAVAPEVKDMQPAAQWNLGDSISVQPRKGWLIYVMIQ